VPAFAAKVTARTVASELREGGSAFDSLGEYRKRWIVGTPILSRCHVTSLSIFAHRPVAINTRRTVLAPAPREPIRLAREFRITMARGKFGRRVADKRVRKPINTDASLLQQ
jgi:hypothetical protein